MKQLEAIKKNLPRGIDVRISAKKVLSFRVRFRKKGYPDQIKTFPDEKLTRQWLTEQERNALLGIHFPQVRASYPSNIAIFFPPCNVNEMREH